MSDGTSSAMTPGDRVFVAGHRGLVGSALMRSLRSAGHTRLLTRTRGELDLTDAQATARFFATEKPEHVFLAAARVGGILANNTYPADFIGALESTNRAYALAKIAGIELCWSYNRQYGTQYLCAMPTNLYGPGDNYDLANSHVIPALLRLRRQTRLAANELARVLSVLMTV